METLWQLFWNPVTFTGKQLQVGDTAHDFSDSNGSIKEDSGWLCWQKRKFLSINPSIDTGVSTQTSSLQPRTLWTLDKYRCYHSFSWFAFCTRQSGALLKAFENVMLSDHDHSFGSHAVLINNGTFWPAQFRSDENNTASMPNMSTNINTETWPVIAIAAGEYHQCTTQTEWLPFCCLILKREFETLLELILRLFLLTLRNKAS